MLRVWLLTYIEANLAAEGSRAIEPTWENHCIQARRTRVQGQRKKSQTGSTLAAGSLSLFVYSKRQKGHTGYAE